jgi:protease I
MEKNSIIIAGNYVQDHEFIYPYYRLLEEEFKVTVVINENQKVKGILGTDIPPNKDQKILSIEEVNEKDFNLLIIPGGVKSMEKVRQNKKIINFISNFNNQGKVIGCICSGVKNRRISGYYALEDDITNAGAIYTDLPAVIDDNIITTAHYKDLGPWMKSVLENFYKRNFNDK